MPFRGNNKNFFEAKALIQQLAYDQLLVAPYSNLHENETLLWEPQRRDALLKFIKQTSAGRDFRAEYHVKEAQIFRAFEAFIKGGSAEQPVARSDALPRNVDDWDDYVWIDVRSFEPDPGDVKKGKRRIDKKLG